MVSPKQDVRSSHLIRWLAPRRYRVAGDEKTIHTVEMAKLIKNGIV